MPLLQKYKKMILEGRKIIVNKSSVGLKEMLNRPKDYQNLMPENLQKFETTEKGFKFSLSGMPEIGLIIEEVSSNQVVLKSDSANLQFALKGLLSPISEQKTEVQLVFEGKFNPFIKMMVEKPLKNFIDQLTNKIEQL